MDMPSTWTQHGLRSGAVWIASEEPAVRDAFLDSLDEGELLALPYLFEFWAMDHQLPPEGDWRSWVIMGGRGAGKPAPEPSGGAAASKGPPRWMKDGANGLP